MKLQKRITSAIAAGALLVMSSAQVLAAPPGAQLFSVYDNTNNGLDVSVDADIGNVEAVANPGGQNRLVIQTHLQKAAPSCTFDVQLVTWSEATNGGLDATGHYGAVDVIGQLTTNRAGNGNAHFDVEVGDGTLDTQMYGHLDFEAVGDCYEAEGDLVVNNEYGAAPDPTLNTPFTWME